MDTSVGLVNPITVKMIVMMLKEELNHKNVRKMIVELLN